jgi:hypothetical protein
MSDNYTNSGHFPEMNHLGSPLAEIDPNFKISYIETPPYSVGTPISEIHSQWITSSCRAIEIGRSL